MKKFNFKFQKILNVREKLELQQKNKLAAAASIYQKLIEKKMQIIERTKLVRKEAFSDPVCFSISKLQTIDMMDKNIEVFRRELDKKIEEAKLKVEEETKLYKQMKRARESINILREKAMTDHKKLIASMEIKALDEINTNRFKQNF